MNTPAGPFRSHVWFITVLQQNQQVLYLAVKHVPDDSFERHMQSTVFPWTAEFCPRIHDIIKLRHGYGLIMDNFGQTLTDHLRNVPPAHQLQKLSAAVIWLAHMHTKLRSIVETELVQFLGTYPENEVVSWRRDTMTQLEWIVSQGLLAQSTLIRLQRMLRRFSHFSLQQIQHEQQKRPHVLSNMTMTHGDCHWGNWLVRGAEFRLIDWEYACIAQPQRDLAGFLQNVDSSYHRRKLYELFREELQHAGWETSSPEYAMVFHRYFFDNTLMMLGWEIGNYRNSGDISNSATREELQNRIHHKLNLLQTSFNFLFP